MVKIEFKSKVLSYSQEFKDFSEIDIIHNYLLPDTQVEYRINEFTYNNYFDFTNGLIKKIWLPNKVVFLFMPNYTNLVIFKVYKMSIDYIDKL